MVGMVFRGSPKGNQGLPNFENPEWDGFRNGNQKETKHLKPVKGAPIFFSTQIQWEPWTAAAETTRPSLAPGYPHAAPAGASLARSVSGLGGSSLELAPVVWWFKGKPRGEPKLFCGYLKKQTNPVYRSGWHFLSYSTNQKGKPRLLSDKANCLGRSEVSGVPLHEIGPFPF